MPYSRKFALVTGASRGIGCGIAQKLAEDGWDLMITCRKQKEKLETLRDSLIEKYGINCYIHVGDAGNFSDTQKLFEQIGQVTDRVDAVVNNAGVSYVGLLTDMAPKEWDAVIHTNLSALFYTSKLAVPLMVNQKYGKILNISSVWGTIGASCEVAYSASKGGMHAFTKALAKELAPSGIQVNAIACGAIDTEMNNWMTEPERKDLIEEIPANRLGTADEVASLTLDLLTNHPYLTGQIITLDGGWT